MKSPISKDSLQVVEIIGNSCRLFCVGTFLLAHQAQSRLCHSFRKLDRLSLSLRLCNLLINLHWFSDFLWLSDL